MTNDKFDALQTSDMSYQFGSQINPPPHHPVFLVVHSTDKKIRYLNPALENYCGISGIWLSDNVDIYKKIIHPEDYSIYLEHLKSLGQGSGKEEKHISIRLKARGGSWASFCFRDRLYNWNPDGEQLILSQASLSDDFETTETSTQNSISNEYRHLLQSLDEAFCIIEMIYDESGKPVDYLFQEINPAFEKQIDLKDVTGKTMRELIPDHEEHWFQTYGKVALTDEPIRFQYKAGKIDNSWLDLYAFRFGDHNSRRVAVLFHNITDQKLAKEKMELAQIELEKNAKKRQRQLEENTALLQTVFDTTNLAIAVFRTLYDREGEIKDFKYIKVNKVLLEMYSDENPLGKTYLETSTHGFKVGLFDELKEVMKTGKAFDEEIYFNKKGYNNWFRITVRSQGDLLIASLEDITERKLKDQELKETIRFKQELVRTSPETIVILNLKDQNVRYINKDIYPEEGLTKERILGTPIADIIPYIHPRDRERVLEFQRKILKSDDDDIHDIEIRLSLKGNRWEWFSVRGKIFHRRDANWVDEYVLLIRNINQQKETQKALINAEKFSIMGEVARTLAHELRNPITSIGMASEVLEKKLPDSEKEASQKYFRILENSTKTLNDMVSNLLNSSNYNKTVLVRQDLAEIIENILEKASDRIYLAGIEVNKNYKGPYYVLADREKLEIALLNIIVNASEAVVPDEGIISIDINDQDKDILLCISDNGHGLEKEQKERLFDAFYTTKKTGVGVGLNSVKSILEEHDSRIEVCSELNKGTTFRIYFPKVNQGG
ncbi:ATP-binding protein [Christiangramia crocea]|uniref:histidine kinase n=1 Tax=Christiangramia crocea TaxID=2904124 RepID=A0A9X1UVW1_9FLAO|nr:ATP-binding protein [Gramella crocea]MCG9970363.1 ATP-binding protein [Gramella crocea]